METITNKTNHSLPKYPGYIFKLANLIVVFGALLALLIFVKHPESFNTQTPCLVCNLLGTAIFAIFMIIEMRILFPLRFHVKSKWYKVMLASFICFVIGILTSILIVYVPKISVNTLIANLSILMILGLITIGIYTYARYKIQKEIFIRRGIEIAKAKKDLEKTSSDLKTEYDKLTKDVQTKNDVELIGKEATSGIYNDEKSDQSTT